MMFNSAKLARELIAAGLPIEETDSTGQVKYARPLSQGEAVKADGILAAHDPAPEPDEATVLKARIAVLEAALKRTEALEQALIGKAVVKAADIDAALEKKS